ncbi:MAG: metallophosphoesterase family protein [Planctomycetota bacterium]|nr:metallophosphoesterase family protein [Planctomycetota bacterium]
MKILVVADIHSNWPALSAIREPFDACLFAGDLVDYGVDPAPCVDWIRQHALAGVRGNHDHAVAQRVTPRPGTGFRELAAATRPLHWELLDSGQLKYLARLPVNTTVECDGLRIALVHATPRDPMDEYLADDAPSWRDRLGGVTADILCVGHTHRQFHLKLPEMQVLNPGSVGQPRDGDPRCAYAIIENGVVHLRRVEYDIDWAVRQLKEAGLNERILEIGETVLRTGGHMPPSVIAARAAARPPQAK